MPCETHNFQAETGPRDFPTTRNGDTGEPGAGAAAGGQRANSLLGCESLSRDIRAPAPVGPSEQSS